jgi:hypothetical protein
MQTVSQLVALGPWCTSAPVVGNPWLQDAQGDVMERDSSDALLLLFRSLFVVTLWVGWHTSCILRLWPLRRNGVVVRTWCGVPLRHLTLQHAHGWMRCVPNEWFSEGLSAHVQLHLPTEPYHAAARTLMERLGVEMMITETPLRLLLCRLHPCQCAWLIACCCNLLLRREWSAGRSLLLSYVRDLDVAAVDGPHVPVFRGLLATIWRQINGAMIG